MTKSFISLPLFATVAAVLCILGFSAHAQTPQWIWHPNGGETATNGEVRFFRKTFSVEARVQKATLAVAADNDAEVFLNGKLTATAHGYTEALHTDVTGKIKAGENVLAVRGLNQEGPAALMVRLEIQPVGQKRQVLVSDRSWFTAVSEEEGWRTLEFKPSSEWVSAVSVGKLGDGPWGNALKQAKATAAEDVTVLPGYKIELLHSAQANEGSWICMTIDPKGRLIISPQRDDPKNRHQP